MAKSIAALAKLHEEIITALKVSSNPLCAIDLYDAPSVREWAPNTDKVSNVLSYMHKRGDLKRVPYSHPTSRQVKFAYSINPLISSQLPKPRTYTKRANGAALMIRIKIGNRFHDFTVTEAQQLRDVLNSLLGGKS